MQWVGDQVEVMEADDVTCVAMIDVPMDMQNGNMGCLTGHDLTNYDYVSVGKDGFIPMSVKQTASAIRLVNNMV
jgi:hypothetical protein